MGAISYQCLHGYKHIIDQRQINRCDQLSMSSRTQALNRLMPNQWARSDINGYTDTSTKSINAKPMGTISYQCLQGHKHVINQCQTNWHDQLSMFQGTQAIN